MKITNDHYITGLKATIQSIPYFGTFLDQTLFEHRGRIKQNRLNKFLENLIDFLETEGDFKYNGEYIRSDEFGDLFESILENVVKTDNEEKLKRLKQVLLNQIAIPQKREYIESFISLIPKITEKQFEILLNQKKNYNEFLDIKVRINEIDNMTIGTNSFKEHIYKGERKKLYERRNVLKNVFLKSENYNISDSEYNYLVQDMISKSLLSDVGIGGIGTKPFEIVIITEFGLGFIEYVSEN